MKQRIITAIIALAVFVPIIIFAGDTSFRICLSIISGVSAIELLQCTGIYRKYIISVILILFAFVYPLTISFDESVRWGIVVAVMFYCMASMVFSNGQITNGDCGAAFTGVFFCTYSYECIALLREQYSWIFLLIFIAAWGSDTLAYFTGRAFGKHKLIPKISPKKTVEGAIGGALGGMVLFPLFGLVLVFFGAYSVNFFLLALIGFLSAIISQIGDLIMSAIKRCYNVKDYGKIFPGHGGFLDRFDSTLTVAPLLYLALELFEIVY